MNLFPKVQTPYFILSPPWTHISSGVRTLHLLCHALNSVGQRAYIALHNKDEVNFNPALATYPLLAETKKSFGDNFIAVYPDTIRGNPLGAKHVVRYLLAPAGKYGGDSTFPETDMIYGALPTIAEKVLRIPVSDTSIFFPPPIERRTGACFYAHKYDRIHGRNLLPITEGSIRLEGSLERIGEILRRSEVCYLYELSSIITEAALCGCPVTLVKTDYFNTIDPECMMGNVRWSDRQIVKESENYLPEYMRFIENFEVQLRDFIKDTQGMV